MGRVSKDHRESRGAGLRPLVLQVTWNLLLKDLLSAVRAGKLGGKKKKKASRVLALVMVEYLCQRGLRNLRGAMTL